MKKILIAITLIMTILLAGCQKNENELVMATEAGFAPYEYYEGGKIVGVDVDIANEIANEMGKKLVIKDVAFDSIINEIKTGKSDFGAAGISYTKERAEEVSFTINYSSSKQVVIVKNNSAIANVNDIKNKKIAVQLGSIADNYVTKNYEEATIIRQKKYLAAVEDLQSSKVDAIVMDYLPAKEIIKNNNNLIILPGEVTSDNYGMIVKKDNKELLDTINKVLTRLKEEGKIDEFIIKHTSK